MYIKSTPISKVKIAHLFIIGISILLSLGYLLVSLIVMEPVHTTIGISLFVLLIYYFAWELDKCS